MTSFKKVLKFETKNGMTVVLHWGKTPYVINDFIQELNEFLKGGIVDDDDTIKCKCCAKLFKLP